MKESEAVPRLLPRAACGRNTLRGGLLDLGKSATGVAIDTGQLVEVDDIQADPRVALETKKEAATQDWTSMLLVPLVAGASRAVGTVNIYRSGTNKATAWEKESAPGVR